MDAELFANALDAATGSSRDGIGRLGERTLHAVLKRYYEPDENCHEQRVGRYVADIRNEEGITEIQTRGFEKLRGKLAAFLPQNPVTVVYPLAFRKWLIWVDGDTGELRKPRLSPKHGNPCEAFIELYKILPFLSDPNFHLRILQLNMEEYRMLNGWSTDKKRGSTRYERIPVSLEEEICIDRPADYVRLLPYSLPEPFTSADYAREAAVSRRLAQTALRVMHEVGVVERVGKQGQSLLYRVIGR